MIYLIKEILKDRCYTETENGMSIIFRLLYTIKALICILLNRHSSVGCDCICVATWGYSQGYSQECWDDRTWEYLDVGRGLFKEWVYEQGSDGNC